MIHIIILILIAVLFVINLILLINVSKNPMYNAMNNYNDVNKRLKELEGKFTYHIQSTDELKPN